VSLLIVVWENVIRSRYGQFVYKDQVLAFSTFSFYFSMENYFRLILIVFCFHCLTPLELELIDLVEIFQTLMVWYTTELLPAFMILTFATGMALVLNFYMNWYSARVLTAGVFAVVFVLAASLLVLMWDFLFASMTSCQFNANPKQYYAHNRSSISYSMTAQVVQGYDWHTSRPETFVMRFEDLYLFFLQLCNIAALYSCTFVWLFLLNDLTARSGAGVGPSFTLLGVGARWLDHALWCFIYSHLALFLVGLRVWLRISIELLPWAV